MPEIAVRKRIITVEEIFHEGGPPAKMPLRRGALVAVIHNPFAGRYVEEIAGFMDDLKPLGIQMAQDLVAALGGAKLIEGYGKGAIVGSIDTAPTGVVPCLSKTFREDRGDAGGGTLSARPVQRAITCPLIPAP